MLMNCDLVYCRNVAEQPQWHSDWDAPRTCGKQYTHFNCHRDQLGACTVPSHPLETGGTFSYFMWRNSVDTIHSPSLHPSLYSVFSWHSNKQQNEIRACQDLNLAHLRCYVII